MGYVSEIEIELLLGSWMYDKNDKKSKSNYYGTTEHGSIWVHGTEHISHTMSI